MVQDLDGLLPREASCQEEKRELVGEGGTWTNSRRSFPSTSSGGGSVEVAFLNDPARQPRLFSRFLDFFAPERI